MYIYLQITQLAFSKECNYNRNMLSALKEGKNKRKTFVQPNNNKAISWKERKHIADGEEQALKQDLDDLNTWVFFSLIFYSFLH